MRDFVNKLNAENKVSSMTFEYDEENNRVVVKVKKYKGDNWSTEKQINYLRNLDNVSWRSNNCINSTNKWQISNLITIAKNNTSIEFYVNN